MFTQSGLRAGPMGIMRDLTHARSDYSGRFVVHIKL